MHTNPEETRGVAEGEKTPVSDEKLSATGEMRRKRAPDFDVEAIHEASPPVAPTRHFPAHGAD